MRIVRSSPSSAIGIPASLVRPVHMHQRTKSRNTSEFLDIIMLYNLELFRSLLSIFINSISEVNGSKAETILLRSNLESEYTTETSQA
jgi:hypothetical protein